MTIIRLRKNTHNHNTWGCPLTKNRSPWCHQICAPKNGIGECGRIAPHGLVGRTRSALLRYKARQAA